MNDVKRKEYLEKIKNNLTIDQIYELLAELGGEPDIRGNYIVSRTICHNPAGEGSFKLYYYDNTKLFKCFTECNDTFDVFQLILKVKKIAKSQISYFSKGGIETTRSWELPDALQYILLFFGIESENQNFFEKCTELQDWKIFNKLEAKKHQKLNKQIVSLSIFQDDFLKNFPRPKIKPWLDEGITQEIMDIHNICYNPIDQGIIIPHYDINNNLIGVRERTLIKEEEIYGKYRPATIQKKMYNHPLSFNLYNINISKDNIHNIKKAIVFEGEKSTLLYGSYFGLENDISVAACGSSLINYQVEILLSLGVTEIIIGFDRQYENITDVTAHNWIKKLTEINKKYGNKVQISYLWDNPKNHLLKYKDSPIDQGPQVFIELFKSRIMLS